jgi:SSS family solute:Na+ symporter/sodium/pantothenate symporter
MSPLVVGITLAASTASAATFIINPGFIYTHGLAAFMHLGISCFLGIVTMLFVMSYKFRDIGSKNQSKTIPGWLGHRYKSKSFAIYFAFINLLSFAFLVLLVGGISIVMQSLLDISNIVALLITLSFVTSYVIIGGTYAHVLTNLLQGGLMIIVSLIIVYTGITLMSDTPEFWNIIQNKNANLLSWVNPESNLYNDFFSVYVSGFLIGAALVCQPHILTKALYVEKSEDITRYLIVFAVVYMVFTMLLFAGFWALVSVPPEQLVDVTTGNFRQDLVMTKYLEGSFPTWLFTIISVVLVAAAMSTLDGLLVGLSTITASDLYLNLKNNKNIQTSQEDNYKKAFRASHVILIVLALLCFIVTLNPPELLGIFGQFGVYALVLTSLPPLLNGVFYKEPSLKLVWAFSILAIIIHISLYKFGSLWFPSSNLAFANPAVPGSIAIICTTIPSVIIGYIQDRKLKI